MILQPARPLPSTLLGGLLVLTLAVPLTPSPARAADEPAVREIAVGPAAKQIQIALMREKFRLKMERRRARAREYRQALKKGRPLPAATRAKRPLAESEAPPLAATSAWKTSKEFGRLETMAAPTNVLVNDRAQDSPATDVCQSEQAIAAAGLNVMVAWNDGGATAQGIATSTNGGATFTDQGGPPAVPGGGVWISDPVVTVNEKTGEFYFCSLVDKPTGESCIGVVKGTFSGAGVLSWGTPVLTVITDGINEALDKEWIVADSLNGNLYLAFTKFTAFDDSIMFQRSTNGGASWSIPVPVSDPAAAGYVQGARPVVGPAGEVYVVWNEIGPVDADFMQVRKSTDFGASFGAQATAATFYANFGSGAPGFNRERGLEFPSVAVDRTTGPNRGRIYVGYNESLNYYDDSITLNAGKLAVENDNFFSRANAFTIGNTLRGRLESTTDLDYFRFNATAGQTYLFWCDSLGSFYYALRIYCGQDTLTRLAFTGDLTSPPGGRNLFIWTAPTTGPYYVRMAFVTGAGSLINRYYRILTALMATNAEPGRDHRDAMISWSDDAVNWSGSVRVNDDAGRYDNWFPEVAVGNDGRPYVAWYDWRDDACGGKSHVYLSRSDDGGATWLANQRVTTLPTAWTTVATNLVPNQGDYIHLFAEGGVLRPAWADGRLNDPDVMTASVSTRFALNSCVNDTTVSPGGGAAVTVVLSGVNQNPLFANTYGYAVQSQRAWPGMPSGSLGAGAGLAFGSVLSVPVPDSAAAGVNRLTLVVTNATGTQVATCGLNVTIQGTVGVGDEGAVAFGLGPAMPNPASKLSRISFRLPAAGTAKLEVYGLRGERVRTLANGRFEAGSHSLAWDGRDDQGRAVAAGTYFFRLEGLGRSATRRMVWLP